MGGKISRDRGYSWEHHLAVLVEEIPDWHCRRLGGSSANMPDLLLVNNEQSTVIATECKSLMSAKKGKVWIYIPLEQIQRCITMVEIFELYRHKEVVLSFKFGRGYKHSYYFTVDPKLWFEIKNAKECITSCDNDGHCWMRIITPDEADVKTPLKRRVSLIVENGPLLH